MNKDTLFEDYFDSIFGNSNKFTESEYEDHSAKFDNLYKDFLPEDKSINILDVGSGAGHFLYFLKKKGFFDFYGIDLSQQQVDFCKEKVSERVECADAFDFLKDKENTYDFITSHDVLEHMQKDKVVPFLKLLHASLKPQGQLFLRVPNMGNPLALRLRYVDFTHNVGFTEKSLRQVLWLGGFRNIQMLPWKLTGFMNRVVSGAIFFCLRKLMWYQGMVASQILTPNLICVAKKDD